jgi:predicted nucleic acid-binding protein
VIILDTNVLSALMRASDNPTIVVWLDRQPRISIWTTSITIMEIRYGLEIMAPGRRRDARAAEIERILVEDIQARILPFDTQAAQQSAWLMNARRISGRVVDLRDTMIAGIALSQNATVATRNVRHFDDLRVPVVDPWAA